MSIKRIAIGVQEKVASRIKGAAGSTPLSTRIIEGYLDEAELERAWQRFYRETNPTRLEQRRAGYVFRRLTKSSRRRQAP